MSAPQTPNYRPTAGGAAAKAPNKNPAAIIIPKWSNFCQQARDNTLTDETIKTIRNVLAAQVRVMIYHAFFVYKTNIYENMPPKLDPRLGFNGAPPLLTVDKYEEQKKLAYDDLRTRTLPANASSSSGSGPNTPTAATASTPAQTAAASSPAASSPGTTPQSSSVASPRPPNAPSAVPPPPPNAASATPPARPLYPKPDDLMPVDDVKQIIAVKDLKERAAFLTPTPGLAERFQRSIQWYSQNPAAFQAGSRLPARPAANVPGPGPGTGGPSTPSANTAPGAPVPSTGGGTAASATVNPAVQRTQSPAASGSPTQSQLRTPQQPIRPAVRPPQPILPATPPADSQPQLPGSSTSTSNAIERLQPTVRPGGEASKATADAGVAPGSTSSDPSTSSNPNSIPPTNPQSATAQPLSNLNTGPAQASGAASGSTPALLARPFNLNLPPQRVPPGSQQQPPPQPPPRPIPIESEVDRRKRKVKEMVAEEAPGMEIEHGVQRILSEYLDAWMDEAAEGAIRLAKHRKSGRVDLKDMALSIDMKHDLRIPGFNVQLPNRTHLPNDDRRRGRAVVPRPARKAREAE